MAFDYKTELHRYQHYYQRLDPVFKKSETVAYAMIVLSLFTISFFGIFAIRPTLTTIISLRREIEDSRFLSQQFDNKIAALISAQESFQQIKKYLPLIYASVPQTAEFPLLLSQIESLANEYNASFSTIQFQSVPLAPTPFHEATSAAYIQNLPEAEPFLLSFSLEADYSRIVQFLERLMGISRMLVIKQLEIKSIQDSHLLLLSVQLQSFYLP